MFGLNWGELVVIGIVALIAIGPKELPTVLRTIGHWTGKMRRMATEFQSQFQEALREAELSDLQKHAQDLSSSVSSYNPLEQEQREIERIGEGAGNLPSEVVSTEPIPAAGPVETAPAPEVSLPMPELPPPVTEKDFAPATPEAPAESEPAPKAAGGSA